MNRLLVSIVTSLLTASLSAQAFNDPNASLRSHGRDPFPGSFLTSAQGTMTLEVGGAAGMPFVLFLGERTANPFCPGFLNGECFELAGGTIPILEIGNGFSGSPFGFLDNTGCAEFALPATVFQGLRPAFQAAVLDMSGPTPSLNMTATCEWQVENVSRFSGDDVFVEYFFPSGTTYRLYGKDYTSMTVSTNGWIKLGTGCTFSDLSESTVELFNGLIGGAPGNDPIIAAYWDDLDLGNDPSQEVTIQEVLNGSTYEVRVRWRNADLFPSTPLGNIAVIIKSTGAIEIDHTGLSAVDGIVGISSGENFGATTITSFDFYNGPSTIPNSFNSNQIRNTIYRNYNVSGPDSPNSLYRLCFQPQNDFGSYDLSPVFLGQACL